MYLPGECYTAVVTKQSNLPYQKKILEEIQEIKQAVVANAHDIKGFFHMPIKISDQ